MKKSFKEIIKTILIFSLFESIVIQYLIDAKLFLKINYLAFWYQYLTAYIIVLTVSIIGCIIFYLNRN